MFVIRAVFRGMFRMVADHNPYAGMIPASVYSLVCGNGSEPAFSEGGPNHQQIAKCQGAVAATVLASPDGRAIGASVNAHLAAGDGDVAAVGILSTADTRAVFTSVGFHVTAGNSERSAVALPAGDVFTTAADAGGPITSFGIDIASADGDTGTVSIPAAANARTSRAAVGIDRTSGYGECSRIGNPFTIILACPDARSPSWP